MLSPMQQVKGEAEMHVHIHKISDLQEKKASCSREKKASWWTCCDKTGAAPEKRKLAGGPAVTK